MAIEWPPLSTHHNLQTKSWRACSAVRTGCPAFYTCLPPVSAADECRRAQSPPCGRASWHAWWSQPQTKRTIASRTLVYPSSERVSSRLARMLSAEWKPLIPGRLVRCCQMGQRSRQPGTGRNFIGCDRGARQVLTASARDAATAHLAGRKATSCRSAPPGHLGGHEPAIRARCIDAGPVGRGRTCGGGPWPDGCSGVGPPRSRPRSPRTPAGLWS